MFKHNIFSYSGKIIVKVLWDLVYFPLWWYTMGLKRLLINILEFLGARNMSLGVSVWIKNWFKPMYGQRDITGKAISFFIRSIQIIVRGSIMVFWIVLCLALLAFYLALPILLVYLIIYQLT